MRLHDIIMQENFKTDPTGSIPPRITSGRPGILIREGENAEIPCTAQGYPVPQYIWYRRENNRLMPLIIGDQMMLVNGSLFIERTRAQDSGKYVCTVNNSVGEVRVETELTVYGNLSVSLYPAQLTTESGRSATLNCSVQGYPVHSITWFKDTRHLVTSNRVRLIANQVLHITSVLREDQGMYQCFVYGSLQSIQSAAQIILSEDAPVLKYVFSRQTIQPGERFSLRCVAAGNPIPRVTWSLDSRPIPENHRVQYGDFVSIHAEVVSFVNVSSARSEDGGVYECRAQNEAGSVSHKERVDVLGAPFIRAMNNVTVVDGDSLFYHCPASGYPLPTVTWSKVLDMSIMQLLWNYKSYRFTKNYN
ncbi:down syndrome cell adhesion molecule-like protein Dscam2 [Trichonephila clavata]|uniref:Down syndrome cell adhesion molecule-like protein Dscam2 n=1 Tax=Trichonephila clavata TaxID=2740835 RepID=A0A8X6KL61_TRICU|nr:down syndrome cell adhesion molecule-like protein Dscam2 [Trichonephila clavata]